MNDTLVGISGKQAKMAVFRAGTLARCYKPSAFMGYIYAWRQYTVYSHGHDCELSVTTTGIFCKKGLATGATYRGLVRVLSSNNHPVYYKFKFDLKFDVDHLLRSEPFLDILLFSTKNAEHSSIVDVR